MFINNKQINSFRYRNIKNVLERRKKMIKPCSISKNQIKNYIKEKTDLMNENQIENYIIKRTLNPNKEERDKQRSNLEKVVIFNSFYLDEVKKKPKGIDIKLEEGIPEESTEYMPEESTESHFYNPTTKGLYMVNTKGIERLERDENLILGLRDILKKDIKLEVIHYHNKSAKAEHRFKEFAFNLVDDVFNDTKEENIKEQGYINIIMGPFESFEFNDTEILHENDNDYLNYKIIRINNKLTISFDYTFAGQADDVLNKIFSNLNANHNLSGIEARIFHYGKVGVLNKQNSKNMIEIGDLCIPDLFIIENDSEKSKFSTYILKNRLSSDKILIEKFKRYTKNKLHFGSTVNSKPILKQKRLELEQYAEEGGKFLDMEWARIGLIGIGKKMKYPNLGNIEYYFAGSASDDPLNGINLGNTDYKRESEIPISEFYKKIIKYS